MIRKSVSVFLAVIMGIISFENGKNATLDKHFTLSSPHLSQSATGETEITPYVSPLKSQVNVYGSADSLPESFDLRETGKITPVRNQTGFGTCWAHSAIASAESSIVNSKPGVNLSEFHTAYYTYSGDDQITPVSDDINDIMNRGGTSYAVTNLWSQWIGPVFEKRLKYGDTDFFKNDENVWGMKYDADYHLKNAYMFDYDDERTNFDEVNSLVKQFIYDGSAVDVSFYSDTGECYSTEFFSTNSRKKAKFSNHSVAIVGWDNTFSADNFKIKPENDGAWLVKNSWGENFGDNGYMWISYEDTSLCEFAVYELENAEKYMDNFHHDTFVALQAFSASDSAEKNEGSYMANVFQAPYASQIEAVSTYIDVPDTEYEITVYTDLEDISNPVSGTPTAVTRGTQSLTGYFNIPLDDIAVVEEYTYFSVVVRLYSENSPYVIPIETSLSVFDDTTGEITDLGSFTTYDGIKSYTGENESFYSADGTEWYDVYKDGDIIYNDEDEEIILAELEEDLFDGIEPDDTKALENAELALEVYRNLFATGTTRVAMGNIALKALGNPVGMVDVSHDSGVVPDGTKIELSTKTGKDIYYYTCNLDYEYIETQKYTEPIEITEYTMLFAYCKTEDNSSYVSIRTYIPESQFAGYGDVNGDGMVDAVDASKVLEEYARVSTGGESYIFGSLEDYADINQDCMIDANDASEILALYADNSTK